MSIGRHLSSFRRFVSASPLVAALLILPVRTEAQVFQIEGGGSSLFEGYGGLVNIWGKGYEASVGIGYLDGVKFGASARWLLAGRDTLRIGNDLLPFTLETDLFSPGGAIFAQGASLQRRRGRTQLWAFAGASASALSAPMFASQRAVRPMGYLRVRHDVTRSLALSAHAVGTDKQSFFGSVRWEPGQNTVVTATAGAGNNSPYGALGFEQSSRHFDVKASLAGIGADFRRASAPMPMQTELERENVLVTWKPKPGWSLGVGRQHFRQDSVYVGIAQRATLNQITGSAAIGSASISGGWLVSQSGTAEDNISTYVSARDQLFSWLQTELYLLQVWKPEPVKNTTPVLLLRESITPQLSLLQVITYEQDRTSVSFGGTLSSGLSSISLDYQVAHSPYLTPSPFVQTMGVNARLHLWGMSLTLGSFFTPDGRVHYSGQGSAFLYRGSSYVGGAAAGNGGRRIDKFMVAGNVVDDQGKPVEGAALDIGGDVLYTDSRGRFFHRQPTDRELSFRVILEEFLMPGQFEVKEAPTRVTPTSEGGGSQVTIVLRRMNRANVGASEHRP